jgi:hypothetical protein
LRQHASTPPHETLDATAARPARRDVRHAPAAPSSTPLSRARLLSAHRLAPLVVPSRGARSYTERRKELTAELTDVQLSRITFVPEEVVKTLIDPPNNFGDRWPSSGLITITHAIANARDFGQVYLHGFDFFKEIDGKIHYMEDTHKANHHAVEEERICHELVKQRRVSFLV